MFRITVVCEPCAAGWEIMGADAASAKVCKYCGRTGKVRHKGTYAVLDIDELVKTAKRRRKSA